LTQNIEGDGLILGEVALPAASSAHKKITLPLGGKVLIALSDNYYSANISICYLTKKNEGP